MTFDEAKEHARKDMIIFEDGVKIFADEWLRNKDYLLDGWSFYLK